MSFKHQLINLLTLILIVVVSQVIFITPAEAITQNFQWTGSAGYLVKGTYSYDETKTTGIVGEKGAGQTDWLKSLQVTFYNPSGEAIDQYFNVVDGESRGQYFEFNLDTTTGQPIGNIDLGGAKSGELFLKGIIDGQLSLIEIESSGKERLIDSD